MSEDRDTRDRVIAIEQNVSHLTDALCEIKKSVDCILERSVNRDKKVDKIENQVNGMAPSVQVLREGLIFWRVSRWILGILIAASATAWGVFDYIKVFLQHFIPANWKS